MTVVGWSTRQLAELAGTTVRAVRHYHDVGLLAEPERRANGYKRYSVAHLIRVLRIKRLTGLGLSLTQIAELGDADEHPEEALRSLDTELAETIERLQRVRAELALILRRSAPTDLGPEVAQAVAGTTISPADRDFVVVLTRILAPSMLRSYAEMVRKTSSDPVIVEFNSLPADADEQTRQDLAERLAPVSRRMIEGTPELKDLFAGAPLGAATGLQAMSQAITDLYNPAQVDVLVRMTR
ncbi:helix-turn-helix domain-containing protein [Crossiella cryophila]|uniref:DNA-binding transcriptional MerR regulator n=1 Tax=Crossiella cryophila TaxID=43355 RepID=A0A7W7CCC0_9PSEU|nr:MerR family transcriptional regulator [Crossiella cryophila]MBB4678510.1 DNA-binding transcriptional MerR regulator [Crossiella cryophila]